MLFKVAFFQFCPLFGQVSVNLNKVVSAIERADVDLVVLPELPFTGYYFQDRAELDAFAEAPDRSPTIASLVSLCRANDFYIVTGFAEKQGDRIFNSALLLGPKGLVHTYRKLHLFNEEKNYFDPGDTPLAVCQVRNARIGIMVCFDWAFPEVTRSLAIQGADVICHPSSLVLDYCQQTMCTRCLENGVFAVTANRFGPDTRPHGELRFTGKSQITGPKGDIVYQSLPDGDDLYRTELDIERARNKQITPLNDVLQDRRPAFYDTLVQK